MQKLMITSVLSSFLLINVCDTENHSDSNLGLRCDIDSGGSRYSKENNRWQHYLESMAQAQSEHVACKVQDGCSMCHDKVIDRDLKQYSEKGISKEMIENAMRIPRVVKYQIIGGKLYRSEDCMFPFRCSGIEHFLLKLVSQLPDMEFVLNTRDWPQVSQRNGKETPVFSFSKTRDYADIMYPAWTFWEGGPAISIYPSGLGRWDLHIESLQKSAAKHTWKEKRDKAFFRGSRTSQERDPLVQLSRNCPHLVDAQYTKNQAWKSDKDTLGLPPAAEVKLEDHCDYRYLFNYRGVAASFRFKHLFLCNSTVFHVGNEWDEFFYASMVPWYHYVPVDSGANEAELAHLLEFAQHHPQEMRQIADQGAEYILRHLRVADVECFWRRLLERYAALLKYSVERDPSLVPITT